MKRKICIVITARAQYGRLKPLILKMLKDDRFELQIIVSGSALVKKYGDITEYMQKENIPISYKIPMLIEGHSLSIMAKSTGIGLIEFSSVFENLKPDIVIVRGDRYEIIAPTIAATYQNIPVAHIEGGDISGSIDEYVRHSVTKLSYIHFTTNKDSYQRVLNLGEEKDRVFNVGAVDIDFIIDNFEFINTNPSIHFKNNSLPLGIGSKIDFKKPYIVIMQHPITTEYKDAGKQIIETIKVIMKTKIQTIFFWPNVDSGSEYMEKQIRVFINQNKINNIHFYRNIKPEIFLSIVNHSSCIVGNSSVAIKECAFLGVPAVNIGNRQKGRLTGENVISVDYDSEKILKAINFQLKKGRYPSSDIYGTGKSSEKIIEILNSINIDNIGKKITY